MGNCHQIYASDGDQGGQQAGPHSPQQGREYDGQHEHDHHGALAQGQRYHQPHAQHGQRDGQGKAIAQPEDGLALHQRAGEAVDQRLAIGRGLGRYGSQAEEEEGGGGEDKEEPLSRGEFE